VHAVLYPIFRLHERSVELLMTRNLDWNFINSFSGWLSAIGTLLAVVVSLWLARRDYRIRVKASVGIRKVLFERKIYQTLEEEPDFLIISVTNIGRRVVTVVGLLWKNRLIRRTRFQFPGEAPLPLAHHLLNVKLPNGKNAVVEIAKLRDYCLSAAHPEGRHNARVFRATLGIGPAESRTLRERLLAAALDQDGVEGEVDAFGQRYVIDFVVEHEGRLALVRAAWIILLNEDFPRLTSCYVLRGL
jgi:hypothetical protein